MEDTTNNYIKMTKNELVILCKEKGIKGYASSGITKEKIIQMLKGEVVYNDLRKKEHWSEKKKDSFEKVLKEKRLKNNLFDYLTKYNPSFIQKFAGTTNNLKTISHGTMVQYKWKCANYLKCLNTFEARPRDVFTNNSKSSNKYCKTCSHQERGKVYQKNMLEKNGSIQTKMPNIIHVWCEDNKFKPSDLTYKSHQTVKLKCPNKSAKHPEYEIRVYNIQESNCFRCSKCVIGTSKAEIRIYSELKPIFKDVKWQFKIEGREADITIEDLKLVIEVDGYPWHKDKAEKDLEKNIIFEKNGYTVVRIRDIKLGAISCNNIVCNVSELSLTDYNTIVEWINTKFKCNINTIDEWTNIKYYNELQASVLSIPYEESIEYLFPESKKIWDYEKNYPFIPSQLSKGSHLDV